MTTTTTNAPDFPGWTMEYLYTMCVWSAYADFLKWRCVNLPGVQPFSISSLSRAQAIDMTIYLLRNMTSTGNRDIEEHNNSNNNNEEEEHDNKPVVEELGGGMYLRYGDPVFLCRVDNGFVTNASGFAVLQD